MCGRFRDGESSAVTALLDTADAFPGFFVALADKDHGTDAAVFETKPTRDDLVRRDHLARLAGALDPMTQGVSDTVLALGGSVREVSTRAYAVARLAADRPSNALDTPSRARSTRPRMSHPTWRNPTHAHPHQP